MTDFLRDERGATAIEYSLIAGLVSIMVVVGATLIGDRLKAMLESLSTGFTP